MDSPWLLAPLKFIHDHYILVTVGAAFVFAGARALLRKGSVGSKVGGVLLMLMLGAHIYLGVAGFDHLMAWVQRHGVAGQVNFSRMEPSSIVVNNRRLHRFVGYLKRQGSEALHPVAVLETNVMQSPEIEGFQPRVGKTYSVRFAESYPAFFVFDHGGEAGVALTRECYERSRRQPDLVARSQLAPENDALQNELRENGEFLTKKCVDVF